MIEEEERREGVREGRRGGGLYTVHSVASF